MSEELKDQQFADRVLLGEHQFLIEATDEKERHGRWVVHRPTIGEEIEIAVRYAQLRTPAAKAGESLEPPQPLDLDAGHSNLAYMVATLNAVTDLRPEWFPKDYGKTMDAALLYDIWEQYQKWVTSFRRRIRDEGGTDSGTPEA